MTLTLSKENSKKTIDELRDKLLKNSRTFKVSAISTSHDACGIKLKSGLNESKIIVFFMLNYNRSLKYLSENLKKMSFKNYVNIHLNRDGQHT